jgi:hypothetical protein
MDVRIAIPLQNTSACPKADVKRQKPDWRTFWVPVPQLAPIFQCRWSAFQTPHSIYPALSGTSRHRPGKTDQVGRVTPCAPSGVRSFGLFNLIRHKAAQRHLEGARPRGLVLFPHSTLDSGLWTSGGSVLSGTKRRMPPGPSELAEAQNSVRFTVLWQTGLNRTKPSVSEQSTTYDLD